MEKPEVEEGKYQCRKCFLWFPFESIYNQRWCLCVDCNKELDKMIAMWLQDLVFYGQK